MYIGSDDEELMGLPEEAKTITADVEHTFTCDVKDVEEGKNFTASEPKMKKEDVVIIKEQNNGQKRRKKNSSNLF